MQPTLGKLPENLRAGGIDPESVDYIVITDIHPDHANGLVDDNGVAVYANAEILVHAQEYDFWMAKNIGNEPEKLKATRAHNKINMKPFSNRPFGVVCHERRLSTTGRNCTRDEGGPFEVGSQVQTSSHRKLLSSKAMVVSVAETPGLDSGR
jgi:metal-dependent hydrolase (beta-lactamase superfamily II)